MREGDSPFPVKAASAPVIADAIRLATTLSVSERARGISRQPTINISVPFLSHSPAESNL